MPSIFFITGFPRSRTAWLANLFTCGPSFCHHDAIKNAPTAGDMSYLLNTTKAMAAGDSDSALPLMGVELDDLMFEARWIFVDRPKLQALDSYVRFLENEPYPLFKKQTYNQAAKAFDVLDEKLSDLKQHLPESRKLIVNFSDLSKEATIKAMWNHALGSVTFPMERWRLLEGMRINVIPSKITINNRKELEALCQ